MRNIAIINIIGATNIAPITVSFPHLNLHVSTSMEVTHINIHTIIHNIIYNAII